MPDRPECCSCSGIHCCPLGRNVPLLLYVRCDNSFSFSTTVYPLSSELVIYGTGSSPGVSLKDRSLSNVDSSWEQNPSYGCSREAARLKEDYSPAGQCVKGETNLAINLVPCLLIVCDCCSWFEKTSLLIELLINFFVS